MKLTGAALAHLRKKNPAQTCPGQPFRFYISIYYAMEKQLQEMYSSSGSFSYDFLRPQRTLNFSDMGLAQVEHTDT